MIVNTPRRATGEEAEVRQRALEEGKDPDIEWERLRQERLVEGTPAEGGSKVTGDQGGDIRP